MSRPRSWCNSCGGMASTLRPSKRISPVSRAFSMRRSVESAVTVFPEADSPTSASFSPALSVKETRSTTLRAPKWMLRSLTSSRLIKHLSRIQSVAQGVADQDQEQEGDHQDAEGGKRDPPRVQIVLPLVQELAQARGSWGHAQAEEVQAGQRADGRGHLERDQRDHRREAVRQDVSLDDLPVALPERARGAHVIEGTVAQELGAHVSRDAEPAEER